MREIEKRLAIVNATLATAVSIRQVLNNSGGVLRKNPRFINKCLYARKARLDRKRRIACTIVQLALNSALGGAQIAIIASQPIPKFKPGTPAIINENAKEEIVYPNSKIGR